MIWLFGTSVILNEVESGHAWREVATISNVPNGTLETTASRHLLGQTTRLLWQAAATVRPQTTAAQDVMELRARLFAIALGIAVLLFVVNLVRTRKLKEEFALLWLLTAVVLVLAPLLIDYLDMVAHALGIEYPPAFIFVLAIICVLLVLFQFSMRISHFTEQIKALTQEVALLRARLEFLEKSPPGVEPGSRLLPGEGEPGHPLSTTNGPTANEEGTGVKRDNESQA